MFVPVLIAVVAIIVILLVVIALRKPTFRYERSITINAPAAAAFALVNDFHKWEAWSPWEKVDPNTKRTITGAQSGVGAKYAWEGNKNVGSGHMEILESKPNELIKIDLVFLKPMPGHNTTEFTFKQEGNNVIVTQAMYGCNSFMGKVFGLFMNMDKMIGGQFEKGLADIKRLAEASK